MILFLIASLQVILSPMSETHLTDKKFAELPISPQVISGLQAMGFDKCTPIQALSLPHALDGRDVAGQAQTGTGKTIAFLTATFHQLLTQKAAATNGPRALIMAPTRELAIQIYNDAKQLSQATGIELGLVYGGENYEDQRRKLQENSIDILIGTTGRLIDFYKQKAYSLNHIEVVVLDEADRMFDLGFIKDIRYIFRRMPPPEQRLNMLYSATLSLRVQELAYEHMNQPEHVHIEPQSMTNKRILEEIFHPSADDKMPLLLTLMEEEWPEKAIVFTNTKHACEEVYQWLISDKHRVGLLTGDVPQKKRIRILEQFTAGHLDILVATDVAARGLHIPKVTHVFNYDLPDDPEDYVHRIGRTGRAGQSGLAISFACESYVYNLPAIEEYIGHAIPAMGYDRDALLDDIEPPNFQRHRTARTKRRVDQNRRHPNSQNRHRKRQR